MEAPEREAAIEKIGQHLLGWKPNDIESVRFYSGAFFRCQEAQHFLLVVTEQRAILCRSGKLEYEYQLPPDFQAEAVAREILTNFVPLLPAPKCAGEPVGE